MNATVRPTDFKPVRLTLEAAYALSGVLDVRTELIDGELIEMPEDGALHREYSAAVGRWLYGSLPTAYTIMPATTLELSEYDGPSPDWYVYPAGLKAAEVRGPDVLLAIEQSHTSLTRDLGLKADLYARFGVREYWVIDLEGRRLHVHRDPAPEGYGSKRRYEADERADALLIPGFGLRLIDIAPQV